MAGALHGGQPAQHSGPAVFIRPNHHTIDDARAHGHTRTGQPLSYSHRPLRDPPGDYGRLLDAASLGREWAGRCSHAAPEMSMFGLCAALMCLDCGKRMEFRLRLDRPKAFMVSASSQTGSVSAVGVVDVKTGSDFLRERAAGVVLPEDVDGPEGRMCDRTMLGILMGVLVETAGPDGVPPPTDFVAAWNSMGCAHESIGCDVYANNIIVRCEYCRKNMFFTLHGESFHVTGPGNADYGMHGADEVLRHVGECVDMLAMPHMMADKMSDDPERDAAGAAELVSLLERRGMLRRVNVSRSGVTSKLAATLSVFNVTREEFEARAGAALKNFQKGPGRLIEDDRPIPPRQALEAARLAWPCSFEGVGVKVGYYYADGYNKFCPKCGFSTMGGEGVDADWRRGCRECGYVGYLLDI